MFFYIILALLIVLIVTNVRVVPQAQAYVVERLGAYYATWHVGVHIKMPLIDRISQVVP